MFKHSFDVALVLFVWRLIRLWFGAPDIIRLSTLGRTVSWQLGFLRIECITFYKHYEDAVRFWEWELFSISSRGGLQELCWLYFPTDSSTVLLASLWEPVSWVGKAKRKAISGNYKWHDTIIQISFWDRYFKQLNAHYLAQIKQMYLTVGPHCQATANQCSLHAIVYMRNTPWGRKHLVVVWLRKISCSCYSGGDAMEGGSSLNMYHLFEELPASEVLLTYRLVLLGSSFIILGDTHGFHQLLDNREPKARLFKLFPNLKNCWFGMP